MKEFYPCLWLMLKITGIGLRLRGNITARTKSRGIESQKQVPHIKEK